MCVGEEAVKSKLNLTSACHASQATATWARHSKAGTKMTHWICPHTHTLVFGALLGSGLTGFRVLYRLMGLGLKKVRDLFRFLGLGPTGKSCGTAFWLRHNICNIMLHLGHIAVFQLPIFCAHFTLYRSQSHDLITHCPTGKAAHCTRRHKAAADEIHVFVRDSSQVAALTSCLSIS